MFSSTELVSRALLTGCEACGRSQRKRQATAGAAAWGGRGGGGRGLPVGQAVSVQGLLEQESNPLVTYRALDQP